MKAPALAALATACFLAGCGEEPQPLDARTAAIIADANFRRVAVGLADASRFLASSRLAGAYLAATDDAERIADFLAQRIFTEANFEAFDGEAVVFRLRAEVVCEANDAACVALLEQVPVRLRASSEREGDLDVEVLLGFGRISIGEIGLHRDELELQLALSALPGLFTLYGLPPDTLSAEMTGRVALGIARHGEGEFTTSLSVLEPVSIRNGAWRLAIDRALPALAAHLDEGERRLTLRFGMGAVDLAGPAEARDGADAGQIALHLGGLTGEATLELGRETDELRLTHLGLGDETTVLMRNGVPVFRVDLNPLAGRAFDLVARAEESGTVVELQPAFDLALAFRFADASGFADLPDWARREDLRIRIDGAAAPSLRLLPGERGPVVEMLAGLLTLESSSHETVTVAAGGCLHAPAAEEAPVHPFAGFAAGACQP